MRRRGSGSRSASHSKSHHMYARCQKESRWNTSQGIPSCRSRRASASTDASVNFTKQVEAHSPNAHSGGTAGFPVRSVYAPRISFGVPAST